MKRKFTMPAGEIAEREFPIFKTPHNHDTDFESDRTAYYSDEPSMTKQEFKDEVDLNTIIGRILTTGDVPIMLPDHFADTTGKTGYYEMRCKTQEAEALFYQLPADIRSEFLNDPGRWGDAVMTALETQDERRLQQLGIDAKNRPQEPETEGGDTTPVTPPKNAAPAAPPNATAPQGTQGGANAPPK